MEEVFAQLEGLQLLIAIRLNWPVITTPRNVDEDGVHTLYLGDYWRELWQFSRIAVTSFSSLAENFFESEPGKEIVQQGIVQPSETLAPLVSMGAQIKTPI